MKNIQNQLNEEIRAFESSRGVCPGTGRGAEDGEDDKPHGGISPPYAQGFSGRDSR